MTETARRMLGDFKGVGHFEAKFYVETLRFAPWTVRWGNGYATSLLLKVSHKETEVYFLKHKESLEPPLEDLGVTYALYL